MAIAPAVSPEKELRGLLMGNRALAAIYVAARLEVADMLADGPLQADELARRSGSHPDALRRLLRVLAGFGIFMETDQQAFQLTPTAALLRSDVAGSMRPVALWAGGVAYRVFGHLEYTVMTGKPAFDDLYGMEFFDYLNAHRDVGDLFDAFMARQTAGLAPALVAAYDFADANLVVDIGGGRGELLATILNTRSAIRGILFETPAVIEGAREFLTIAGMASRVELVAGDLASGPIPSGGDTYVLKSVVHGVSDAVAQGWLARIRAAMGSDARLLLVEFVIPPGNDPNPGKLMDLLMLAGSQGGRERTEAEFRELLAQSGFALKRVLPTRSGYCVIEALAS